jgi:hypothetical protein
MQGMTLLASVLFLVGSSGAVYGGERRTLSRQQCNAIAAAEEFIADNGYTESPPSTDAAKWRPELQEERLPLAAVVASRRGQLLQGATGLFPGRAGEGEGWTILFKYRQQPGNRKPGSSGEYGRGVYVPERDATELFIQQLSIKLDTATIRLDSRETTSAACGWGPRSEP